MIGSIISLLYNAIDGLWDICQDVYSGYGLSYAGIALAVIIVSALARYLLRPFIASGASDKSSGKNNRKDAKSS